MAAGLEKTLAHSRSRDQIEVDKYAIFFKMAARNKVREIWVRQLPTKWSTKGEPKAVKFDVRNQKYGWINVRATRMR